MPPRLRRNAARRKALSLFLLLLLLPPLASCDKGQLKEAEKAARTVTADLSEAERITNRLSQSNLITVPEQSALKLKLSDAQESVSILSGRLRDMIAAKNAPTKDDFSKLASSYGGVVDKVESFKLTVTALTNSTARESFQPVVARLAIDLDNVAYAVGCEKIDDHCVKCRDGQIYCSREKTSA
jgi:hypothetical protein